MGIYLGAGGVRTVREIYVGVNGALKRVKEGYVGVAGAPKRFYTAAAPAAQSPPSAKSAEREEKQ